MRNITIAIDDETYRRARIAAATLGTSVSALVKAYLQQIGAVEPETQRLKRQECEIRARIVGFTAGEVISREEIHDRRR